MGGRPATSPAAAPGIRGLSPSGSFSPTLTSTLSPGVTCSLGGCLEGFLWGLVDHVCGVAIFSEPRPGVLRLTGLRLCVREAGQGTDRLALWPLPL